METGASSAGGREALLRGRVGGEEHHARDHAEQRHRDLKAGHLAAATEELHEGAHEQRDDEAAAEGAQEAEGREGDAVIVVVGDDAHQRRVGHVDGGVDHLEDDERGVREEELAGVAEVGVREERVAAHAVGDGHPQQEGAVATARGPHPVGEGAHEWIVHRVPEVGDEVHGADRRRVQAENVGVVVEQEDVEELEVEVRRGVAEPVPDLLDKPDALCAGPCLLRGHHQGSVARQPPPANAPGVQLLRSSLRCVVRRAWSFDRLHKCSTRAPYLEDGAVSPLEVTS